MANRALRAGVVSVFFLLLSGVAFCISGTEISIAIHNDAPVPQRVLEQATQEASRIFHKAGVNSIWTVCQVSNAELTTSPDCLSVDLTHLSLRIVPWSSPLGDSTFGVAFLSEKGEGTYSDVFYPLAENLSRRCDVSLGRVLGQVMAHEVGHLLLGSNSHSTVGIMRPQWRGEELRQIGMGKLLFTPEQVRKMHARLLAIAAPLAADASGRSLELKSSALSTKLPTVTMTHEFKTSTNSENSDSQTSGRQQYGGR